MSECKLWMLYPHFFFVKGYDAVSEGTSCTWSGAVSLPGLLSSVNVSMRNVLVWQGMVQPQPQDRLQSLEDKGSRVPGSHAASLLHIMHRMDMTNPNPPLSEYQMAWPQRPPKPSHILICSRINCIFRYTTGTLNLRKNSFPKPIYFLSEVTQSRATIQDCGWM